MDNKFVFARLVLIEQQKISIKALIAENRGIASEAVIDHWL
ncbi:hypothetical protein [Pseudomonas sp. 5Ae-yellow]|nr:hypothetical protein [Pseudomonas sp. 5Ae-yellow]